MDIKKITIRRSIGRNMEYILSHDELSPDKRIKTVTDYDINGEVLHRLVIKYDEKHRAVEREDSYPKQDIVTKVSTEYAEFKRIDREYFSDGGNNRTVITADKDGHVLSVEKYDDEDSDLPFESAFYEYSETGSLKSTRTMDREKNIVASGETVFHDDGRAAKAEYFRDGMKSHTLYKYDEKGRIAGMTSDDEKTVNSEIKYNDKDGSREEIYTQGDSVTIQKYNSKNLLVSQESRTELSLYKTSVSKIAYDYGDNGLLLSVTMLDDTNPLNSYTNTYEYEFF